MLRQSLRTLLRAPKGLRRHIFLGYKLNQKIEKSSIVDENSWERFFLNTKYVIDFDLDRTLLNLQEGEVDEYAVRFIMQNFDNFKSYQIVRALLFIRSFEVKTKMINHLLELIAKGDKQVYAQDLEVICLLKMSHFQLNPMLREFCLYNIATHFTEQNLRVKSLCMGYMLRINRISDSLLDNYLASLAEAEVSKSNPLKETFSEWNLQNKLNFLFTLQFFELIVKPEDKLNLIKRVRETCFELLFNQFEDHSFLKGFINFQSQALMEFNECFFFAYGETRLRMVHSIKNLLKVMEDGIEEEMLSGKRRFCADLINLLVNNLTQAEKEYLRQNCKSLIEPVAIGRMPLNSLKVLSSLELVSKRVVNLFISEALKKALRADVMLDQTKNHHPLLRLCLLHELNIRESFMPSEEAQQTWEQLKRQIYRTLFHRIVSFDTRQTLQQVLEIVKSPSIESNESLTDLTISSLVNSERYFQEIKGYNEIMQKVAVQKQSKDEFLKLQKMFDTNLILMQDPEESVVMNIDADIEKIVEKKDPEISSDSNDEQEGDEKESDVAKEKETTFREVMESIRYTNKNTHKMYSPIRNQYSCSFHYKLVQLQYYFGLCATLICDSPNSIAKTDLGPITTFLSAPEVYELVNLLGSQDNTVSQLLDIYRWDSDVVQNPKLVALLQSVIDEANSLLNSKAKHDVVASIQKAFESSKTLSDRLQDGLISSSLYLPAKTPLDDARQSHLVSQLELRPSIDFFRLIGEDGKLSESVLLKQIVTKNPLFLRMMNQSVLYTCTEHQLRSEGLVYSKHVWAYPYMADFVISKDAVAKVLGADKAMPIAIFVADSTSRQVGMDDLSRYCVSQSKRYFSREGHKVLTIQPDNFKLRKNNQELITDLIKGVEAYAKPTN